MFAGDIESAPFIEALGQFSYRVGKYHLNPKEKLSGFCGYDEINYCIFWLVVEFRPREFLSGPCQPRACA